MLSFHVLHIFFLLSNNTDFTYQHVLSHLLSTAFTVHVLYVRVLYWFTYHDVLPQNGKKLRFVM
jgi:hypothetical protein